MTPWTADPVEHVLSRIVAALDRLDHDDVAGAVETLRALVSALECQHEGTS